jgi:hypothetical protein
MNLLPNLRRRVRLAVGEVVEMKMKIVPSLAVLAALFVGGLTATRSVAAEDDGVALAIIYDTSGSMQDAVPDQNGGSAPKYVIASRALAAVVDHLQAFATNRVAGAPRKIYAGVFAFKDNGAREAVPFGPFDAAAIKKWAASFSHPNGNTPLGNALNAAAQKVLNAPLARKHVLIITDGKNTAGPDPASVLPKLRQRADQKETMLSVHFVAFDVDAKEFDGVKKLGATVVGAADEKQLNTQLDYILQRKILLEEEEPKR